MPHASPSPHLAMASNDDEFEADEIDWSEIPLHLISSSVTTTSPALAIAPSPPVLASNSVSTSTSISRHTKQTIPTTEDVGHHFQSSFSLGDGNINGNDTSISNLSHRRQINDDGMKADFQNNQLRTMGAALAATESTSNIAANKDVEALRRQIQELQNQLEVKNDQIFELEAISATCQAESIHRTQEAENLAQKRIHLMEEELRRTRMEAEKYKGSWMRQKKRVVELECGNNNRHGSKLNGSGGDSSGNNHNVWNDHYFVSSKSGVVDEGVGNSTVDDVEMGKVTPNISNDDHDTINGGRVATSNVEDDAEDGSSRCAKRKYHKIGNTACAGDATSNGSVGITHSTGAGDSVRQRIARLMLCRDEMGCHSIAGNEYDALVSSLLVDDATESVAASIHRKIDRVQTRQNLQPSEEKDDKSQHTVHQDHRIQREIRAFVKSVLYQIAEAPEGDLVRTSASGYLSVSGLCHVLLVKLNSLFNLVDIKRDSTTPVDGVDDHPVMELDNDSNPTSSAVNNFEYQRMVLLSYKNEGSHSKVVTHATFSWNAVIYLLSVIHDILLSSDKARDDLRWWLYQSRQSIEGCGRTFGDDVNRSSAEGWDRIDSDETVPHSRIKGLFPIKQGDRCNIAFQFAVVPTTDYKSKRFQQSNGWDPISMNEHHNIFFELIVGLMKGNLIHHSKHDKTGSESFDVESERKFLAELVQLKAIELVSTLMSDADPDDREINDHGNRTPSLWNYWFEALLKSPSQSSDAYSIGDFFTPWEMSDPSCAGHSLGSGRKHSTRLLKGDPCWTVSQKAGDVEKIGHTGNKSSHAKSTSKPARDLQENEKVHGHLAILIKSKILRLFTHVVSCSLSVHNSLYHMSRRENKSSLAKRVVAALLDCIEEYIVPFLSSLTSSDVSRVHDAEQCLRLCLCCIQFLTILTRKKEGLRLLRMQMRLESGTDEPSRWSQSAIGCMTSILNCTLDFAQNIEQRCETSNVQSNNFVGALNEVVGACIHVFKMILLSLEQECTSSSKALTLIALVSEHSTLFESCCRRILAYQSPTVSDPPRLLHISVDMRNDVRCLLEELYEAP